MNEISSQADGSMLADAAHDMPPPVFAAIDGAQFDDLPAAMQAAKIICRSLFLGVADTEAKNAGPWLANVDAMAAMDRFLELLGDKPAAVFWTCPAGEVALYRHLRMLNEAIVPLLRADAPVRPGGEARPASDYREERVLFRHWDPRVLTQVLPLLDDQQLGRVFGPAATVLLPREDGAPPHQLQMSQTVVITPQGPLRLRLDQMNALKNARAAGARRKIANYLRNSAPDQVRHMQDDRLNSLVTAWDAEAISMGLRSERAKAKWCYLCLVSNDRIGSAPGVKQFITTGHDPDANIDMFMRSLAAGALRLGHP